MSAPTTPQPPTGPEQPSTVLDRLRGFWRRRSWKGKTAIIGGLVLLALIVVGALAPAEDGDSGNEAADTQPASPPPPPPPAPEPPTPPPPPPPAAEADTGRMSETEYELFQQVQSEVVDESLQFSDEFQACAVIGQAGQLAEFRDCVEEAYGGFEEDAQTAYAIAQDTLDDVGKKCKTALNSYVIALNDYSAAVQQAHETASLLQFEQMPAAFNQLPRQSRRYVRFATNALGACEPR